MNRHARRKVAKLNKALSKIKATSDVRKPVNGVSLPNGIPATLTLGGMVYRAGPDPHRDVVAFCGPGNVGQFVSGQGILGHYWIESGSDVIDFSVGDWRGDMTPDLSLEPDDQLGPIQWAVDPPDFLWLARVDLGPTPGQYAPELGKAYYTGWRGTIPAIETSLQELKTALDWGLLADHTRNKSLTGSLTTTTRWG